MATGCSHPLPQRPVVDEHDDVVGLARALGLELDRPVAPQQRLVRSSVFAPTMIERNETAMVQVYLYLEGQFQQVAGLAHEWDQEAVHRGFHCLDTKIARG